MRKNVAISVRVSESLKQAAEKAASDDRRSVASFVEKLLVEHLTATGYLALESEAKKKGGRK